MKFPNGVGNPSAHSKTKIMANEKYIPALGFGWLTPLYDPVVQLTTREKTFKKALVEQSNIKAGQKILDLACGTGTLTILLKQKNPDANIIGFDGDENVLKIAKEKSLGERVEIKFDKGLSFELPYPVESFDRVVSSFFFHHLTRENKARTFREVRRVLKPNGEFHIADWGFPANLLMRFGSYFIQILDGFETTADNFEGLLPEILKAADFENINETESFNTVFGTIRLYKTLKH